MKHSVQSVEPVQPVQPGHLGIKTTTAIYRACIGACFECGQTSKTCADSCLSEDMGQEMVECIRICLQCADVCNATGYMLLQRIESDESILRNQLRSCIAGCKPCCAECEKHADTIEQCRVCAESSRNCAEICISLYG